MTTAAANTWYAAVSGDPAQAPEFVKVTCEFGTTTSGSCDNATAVHFKVWLGAACTTRIRVD